MEEKVDKMSRLNFNDELNRTSSVISLLIIVAKYCSKSLPLTKIVILLFGLKTKINKNNKSRTAIFTERLQCVEKSQRQSTERIQFRLGFDTLNEYFHNVVRKFAYVWLLDFKSLP